MRRYLAYGSNMIVGQMRRRCPAARQVETLCVPGWRFVINRRGVATILPDPEARICGLLWQVSPACETALDRYEGIAGGWYRRAEMLAGDASALVYLATDTAPGAPRAGYLEGILRAAAALGFDDAYCAELASWRATPPG